MEQSRTIQSFDEVKVRSTSSEAHTNVRFLSCDGHQLYERGVDLEVEGVRYIEMHRGPAAYVLGPPEPRSRTRRRSHCMPRRLRIRDPRLPRARYRVMAS